ncbi:MAG TPA: hypothetical protein VJ044_00565, partial [Candidatus Hodarchaeales archaeon]|nr:hypothetical protein [Candidatus Hodarchaeales archaeon]
MDKRIIAALIAMLVSLPMALADYAINDTNGKTFYHTASTDSYSLSNLLNLTPTELKTGPIKASTLEGLLSLTNITEKGNLDLDSTDDMTITNAYANFINNSNIQVSETGTTIYGQLAIFDSALTLGEDRLRLNGGEENKNITIFLD